MIAGAKNELNILLVMPLLIMLAMRGLGAGGSGGGAVLINILAKLVALSIFAAAYFVGSKLVDIRM